MNDMTTHQDRVYAARALAEAGYKVWVDGQLCPGCGISADSGKFTITCIAGGNVYDVFCKGCGTGWLLYYAPTQESTVRQLDSKGVLTDGM